MNDSVDKKLLQPLEVKKKLDSMSEKAFEIYNELYSLIPYFEEPSDLQGIDSLTTDLFWAVENLTVLGLHQVGLALDDNQF